MVYNFVDRARIEVPATSSWQVREELKRAPHHQLVGVISDFLPRKGQLYLVRALADVLSAAPNTMVVFVGHIRKHEYYEGVRNDAVRPGAMNHILWRRYRSDIPRLLSALDGYALPSREEIFPVATLPAMAAGSACVASSVEGIPVCNAEPGSLILGPLAQPEPLSSPIVRLLADDRD